MFYDVTQLHQLMNDLHEMATHDGLTGLLNRATFFRYAQRDFELARRAEQDISVLMLDIDFFKNVNDQHGHQCGDEVLSQVADILRERLRRTDICGRYGGEEFCVLLPGADAGPPRWWPTPSAGPWQATPSTARRASSASPSASASPNWPPRYTAASTPLSVTPTPHSTAPSTPAATGSWSTSRMNCPPPARTHFPFSCKYIKINNVAGRRRSIVSLFFFSLLRP